MQGSADGLPIVGRPAAAPQTEGRPSHEDFEPSVGWCQGDARILRKPLPAQCQDRDTGLPSTAKIASVAIRPSPSAVVLPLQQRRGCLIAGNDCLQSCPAPPHESQRYSTINLQTVAPREEGLRISATLPCN